jgi:hypothetical protein
LGREIQDYVYIEVAMKIISRENWHNAFGFYGWQDEIEIKGTMEKYYEMVLWICEHITDPTENVCWTYARGPVFRFRKSKDQAWFMLRWA